ncbi:MAG: hypothetical protein NTX81_01865 [Candidatus Bathyarchaeota archaeon]|nr:hypothetical protein [Candidatus Bathyarchaeota archaeon]
MKGKQRIGKVRKSRKNSVNKGCSRGQEFLDEHGDEISTAVKESVARFVTANCENIRRSTKEQIAIASYGGGMTDMVMLVRRALGRFAVEQLLIELENWSAAEESSVAPSIKINVTTDEKGEISQEQVKELGEQIAKWVAEKKNNGKRQCKDPMFA